MLDSIRNRVATFPWHEAPLAPAPKDSWPYGTDLSFMRDLCAYWVDGYDWHRWEAELNRLPQFTCPIDELDIHFYRVDGAGSAPRPLLLSHGWPGSVFEFLEMVEPLAHPERFGGDAEDAFTVVAPSLPGYGFSAKPSSPIGPRRIARMFDKLMTESLRLPGYIAHGGDWGALISGWLGYEGRSCAGVHLTKLGWVSPGVQAETEDEVRFAEVSRRVFEPDLGYLYQQTHKPQTLSYAMMDSPVGVCAWVVEKFHGWSDIRRGFAHTYTRDQLLTSVMIYLVTRTFNTASWLYRGFADTEPGPVVPAGARIERPVAVANFRPVGAADFPPGVDLFPPRRLAERSLNVIRWSTFDEGGHFPALEQPDVLMDDIRRFARQLREQPSPEVAARAVY